MSRGPAPPPPPAYRRPGGLRRLAEAAGFLAGKLAACDLCPRACGVDRTRGERGRCRAGAGLPVASHGPHRGEEACLVGRHGSGTVFLAGCNLRCAFCQNDDIARADEWPEIGPEEAAAVFLRLERLGCHNLNLVTPTHVAPGLLRALALAAERGFSLPVVWNTSGYESLEVIAALDGVVDLYMPDLKFVRPETAAALADAPDYWDSASAAAAEMQRQTGDLATGETGIARRGVIFRHLVLPEGRADTPSVMAFIRSISIDPYVNLMDQWRPCGDRRALAALGIDRMLAPGEFEDAVACARALGIENERGARRGAAG